MTDFVLTLKQFDPVRDLHLLSEDKVYIVRFESGDVETVCVSDFDGELMFVGNEYEVPLDCVTHLAVKDD